MGNKCSLVILTKDEIRGVNNLFNSIPFNEANEVFVIDGQSKDGTVEFFNDKKISISIQEKLGRGEAFRIALEMAKYPHIIFFSPDGNEDPKDITKIKEYLNNGADLVIASRFMKGARADDSLKAVPYRGWGNKFFTVLANLFFNGKMTDSINGFRGCKKDKIKELHLDAEGFAIEYQMSIRSLKRNYNIREFPTYEGDRIGGKSGAKTIQTGLYFLKLVFKELLIGNTF